ncbi:hypothetical protein FRB94_012526 [Tulasnella sp. JGI-2019a]|nr:hypothetical protein FRB94_012526 [Tulasnella sp. JGI-2019a]
MSILVYLSADANSRRLYRGLWGSWRDIFRDRSRDCKRTPGSSRLVSSLGVITSDQKDEVLNRLRIRLWKIFLEMDFRKALRDKVMDKMSHFAALIFPRRLFR